MIQNLNSALSQVSRRVLLKCRSTHVSFRSYGTGEFSSTDKEIDEESLSKHELYPDHIPTSFYQKALLTLGSAAMALTDPYRDDMVAVLGETTGATALRKLLQRMKDSPEGSQILREQPRINSSTVNLEDLKKLPPSSFGNVYATFMLKHGITSDSRQPVHFVDDPECAYVLQRYREGHDLVHALLDMPTNMLGEVAVKWIEALQTDLPMCVTAALFGPLQLKPKLLEKYRSLYLPWAIRCGLESELFLNVYFEKRWSQPVEDLRNELKIPPLIIT